MAFAGLVGLVGGAALSGRIVEENGKLVQDTTKALAKFGVNVKGSTALMLAGAVAGSAIMHRIGNVIGIAVGTKKSGEAEAQFDRTQARIAMLEQKLDTIEGQSTTNFVEREAARATTSEPTLER